jgi:hypothetical protein
VSEQHFRGVGAETPGPEPAALEGNVESVTGGEGVTLASGDSMPRRRQEQAFAETGGKRRRSRVQGAEGSP